MIQKLFNKIKFLEDEVRRLKGRLDALASGNKILPSSIPSFVAMPTPSQEGQVIVADDGLVWIRLDRAIPAAGQRNVLSLDNGDVRPNYNQSLATATPEPVGTGAVGTSLLAAREDHVHDGGGGGGLMYSYIPFGSGEETFSP